MIDKTALFFEKFSKLLGLSLTLPRPGRAAKRICGMTNGLIGFALLSSGVLYKKTLFIILGALGLAGAAALALDEQEVSP